MECEIANGFIAHFSLICMPDLVKGNHYGTTTKALILGSIFMDVWLYVNSKVRKFLRMCFRNEHSHPTQFHTHTHAHTHTHTHTHTHVVNEPAESKLYLFLRKYVSLKLKIVVLRLH